MSDHFDYMEEGAADEAERDFEEMQFYQRQKDKQFKEAVAAEVKRQLAKNNTTQPHLSLALKAAENLQVKPKPVSRGKTRIVNCNCCGKPFEAREADLKRGWAKSCSKSCKAKKQESETGQFMKYLAGQLK